MKPIQQFQIRKIYAIGHALGITSAGTREDELHTLVSGVTGKDSIKEMSYTEAEQVIARLEELQGKSASPKLEARKERKHREKQGGVTEGQQKKIWALMYELKKHDVVENDVALGDRLCKIIKKELGIDATAKDPFIWLVYKQGNQLIETLKGYIESAKRKGEV